MKKLEYKHRVAWFIHNYYETGMEFLGLLRGMEKDNTDLDNFEWYGELIVIPTELSNEDYERYDKYCTKWEKVENSYKQTNTKKECIYDVCWSGICKETTIKGSDFCKTHLNMSCQAKTSSIVTKNIEITLSQDELTNIIKEHYTRNNHPISSIQYDIGSVDFVGENGWLLAGVNTKLKGKSKKLKSISCEEQAVGDCHSYAGSFVCGSHLCKEHKKEHNH